MRILLLAGALGVAVSGTACSRTLDRQRAAYHDSRADRAAAKGDYYKAAEHQRKADEARRLEAVDRLP